MKDHRVSILAIGNEIISGKITDTNSRYLARLLDAEGLFVRRVASVGDTLEDIRDELLREAASCDLIITTGGLGPTSDDLTRDAVAAAAGAPLEEHEGAKTKLEQMFAARKRPLTSNNLRQVMFPRGAEVVPNRAGTADAFITGLNTGGRTVHVVSLPGVPRELAVIYDEELRLWLQKTFPSEAQRPARIHMRCFGPSEAYIGQQIEAAGLPERFEVAYRPMFPEILVSIGLRGAGTPMEREHELRQYESAVVNAVGAEFVISRDADETLGACVGKLLTARSMTIAAGESCSGGLLADMLVSSPGASQFFLSSVVSYSNDSKSIFLGVRPAILARCGAVSEETAVEMARAARHRTGASIGLSITGVAGPDGGSEEKPVGTFFVGIATERSEEAFRYFYPQERNMIRAYSAAIALDLVRRELLGLPLRWERR